MCVCVHVHACTVCVCCFYWECLEFTNPCMPIASGLQDWLLSLSCQRALILRNTYTAMLEKKSALLSSRVQPLLCAGIILSWRRLKDVAILSAHFMSVSSILCHDTPCASHLLCKNHLTWHHTDWGIFRENLWKPICLPNNLSNTQTK